MSIILEGPDLAGKDSLIEEIGWPQLHRPDARGIKKSYEVSMDIPEGDIIVNRWWLTEQVYGTLFRCTDDFNSTHLWQMGLNAAVKGSISCILDETNKELTKRYITRGDNEHLLTEILLVANAYRSIKKDICGYFPSMWRSDPEVLVRRHIEVQTRLRLFKTLTSESWGSLGEGINLFVGDSFNIGNLVKYPFQVLNGSSCGNLLWEALDMTRARPYTSHVLNSMKIDGTYQDWDAIVEFFKPRRIIALGKEARERLHDARVEHRTMPHPSYWKRFHYKDIAEYGRRLEVLLSDS